MTDLGARILLIFAHIRTGISQSLTQDRARNDRLGVLWPRLFRVAARLKALLDRWKAGTLPKSRASRAGRAHKPRAPRPAGTPPCPRGRGWLANSGWQVRIAAVSLDNILREPDFQAFLAAASQAGRLLRPWLHLLRLDPPPVIALPPRPRKPREKKPRHRRDPKPPRVYGGIVARNLVRDIAGNIKATPQTVRQTPYRNSG